jgi:hypothetical protein
MARRRKSGKRTKSGRLSRAYKHPDLRDYGTPEFAAKRNAAINGADPQLAATASGILLANGYLTQSQHHAALKYARWHSLLYGSPWATCACPLSHELAHHGREPPENLLVRAKHAIDAMNARLDPDQRQAVANVAVFGFVPQWFFTIRLKLRPLPSDARERRALLEGLDALGETSWRRVA